MEINLYTKKTVANEHNKFVNLYPTIIAWNHTLSSTSYLHPKVKLFGHEGVGSAPVAGGGGYSRTGSEYRGSASTGGGYGGSGGAYGGSGGGDVKFRERSVTDEDPSRSSQIFIFLTSL
ncbi:hypothetical protein R6Q59_020541 [Mikania micrantha]